MMRPVQTREEYMTLRDSEWQKSVLKAVREGNESQKSKLIQMNYSCLPNDDGTLKGSTTMSTSVGMDIDWTPSPVPPSLTLPNCSATNGQLPHEGGEQITARKEEWLRKVPELVLSKKEQLGLLMLERSATKGYHLVFKRRPDLSQEENLQWAADLLGVDFDKGAKDITRVFFTTTGEELLFLDDEIFRPTPAPSLVGRRVVTLKAKTKRKKYLRPSLQGRGLGEGLSKASHIPLLSLSGGNAQAVSRRRAKGM